MLEIAGCGEVDLFQRGIVEDGESSTGLFVEAETPDAALAWAAHVASALLEYVNRDPTLDDTRWAKRSGVAY